MVSSVLSQCRPVIAERDIARAHLRDADVNSSADEVLCDVYRVWILVTPSMSREKTKPMPI